MSGVVEMVIPEPLSRDDGVRLSERAQELLAASDAEMLVCDVGPVAHPDVGTVDALARLALTARRSGCQMILRNGSSELQRVIAMLGLTDVMPFEGEMSSPTPRERS